MAMTEDALAACPYYKEDGGQVVRCEGPYHRSGLHLSFANRYQLSGHKRKYCQRDWAACPIAGLLNRKYDYTPH